jgi:sporulation protein YlmC with PRC-barrel domain
MEGVSPGVTEMDLPIQAQVECLDGRCGQSTCVLINPATQFVTHIVVEDKDDPAAQYLVPLDAIKLSTPHLIQLRCTIDELKKMPRFVRIDYERRSTPYPLYLYGSYLMGSSIMLEDNLVPIPHLLVPEGELAVHQGAQVQAHDGHLGQLDEFLLDPTTEQIDYVVFHERHLWHQKALIVPASQIEQIKDDTIYLKINKQTIEQMQA